MTVRALIIGLTLLHLGPAIAFMLLAFGCVEPDPVLRAVCGPRPVMSFAWLALGSWVVLGVGFAAWHFVERARRAAMPSLGSRLAALCALLALGGLVALGGILLTGSNHAMLAVPTALALGWLRLANPEACVTRAAVDPPRRD